MNLNKKFQSGFTLIELLVVVAIIGILAAVILVSSSAARGKGVDTAVKSNLATMRNQGEIFYNSNTAAPNTYTQVCTNGIIGGVQGVGAGVLAAAKARNLAGYATDPAGGGTSTTATCNDTGGNAWAAEVPLSGSTLSSPLMWCVDSVSTSRQETTSIGTNIYCP